MRRRWVPACAFSLPAMQFVVSWPQHDSPLSSVPCLPSCWLIPSAQQSHSSSAVHTTYQSSWLVKSPGAAQLDPAATLVVIQPLRGCSCCRAAAQALANSANSGPAPPYLIAHRCGACCSAPCAASHFTAQREQQCRMPLLPWPIQGFWPCTLPLPLQASCNRPQWRLTSCLPASALVY